MRKGALLDLLLVNTEDLTAGHLSHSDHEVVKFKFFGDMRKTATKTSTPDLWRADSRLSWELVRKLPWDIHFEGTGAQQCWSLFKYHLLRPKKLAIPKHQKLRRQCRRPAWPNRGLLLELRQKVYSHMGRLHGCCLPLQGENLCS